MKDITFTPEEVEALFKGANFGTIGETHKGRIALMTDCVFKSFAGYSSGHTIEVICIEAGLLTAWDKPTKPGARWAYKQAFPLPNVIGMAAPACTHKINQTASSASPSPPC